MEMSEIDVVRDLLDIKIDIKDEIAYENLEYSV